MPNGSPSVNGTEKAIIHVPKPGCVWEWQRWNVYLCHGCGLWWIPNPGIFTHKEPE